MVDLGVVLEVEALEAVRKQSDNFLETARCS